MTNFIFRGYFTAIYGWLRPPTAANFLCRRPDDCYRGKRKSVMTPEYEFKSKNRSFMTSRRLTEDHLCCLLTESGEMRRWEERPGKNGGYPNFASEVSCVPGCRGDSVARHSSFKTWSRLGVGDRLRGSHLDQDQVSLSSQPPVFPGLGFLGY